MLCFRDGWGQRARFFKDRHCIVRPTVTTVHGEVIYSGKVAASISPASGDGRLTAQILAEEREDLEAALATETGLTRVFGGTFRS